MVICVRPVRSNSHEALLVAGSSALARSLLPAIAAREFHRERRNTLRAATAQDRPRRQE